MGRGSVNGSSGTGVCGELRAAALFRAQLWFSQKLFKDRYCLKGKNMKATWMCLVTYIGLVGAMVVGPAGAQENCSRKVVKAILQEELGENQKPLSRDINKEVRLCEMMEKASAAEDRCSAVVAHASLIHEGIENPLQRQITQRVYECKNAQKDRQAAGADKRCSAEVVRAALVLEGVEDPTHQEVTAKVSTCKADEYYLQKIMESKSSLDKLDAEKSLQMRMTTLVNTVDSLRKLREAWLVPMNKDWDTRPLITRGN